MILVVPNDLDIGREFDFLLLVWEVKKDLVWSKKITSKQFIGLTRVHSSFSQWCIRLSHTPHQLKLSKVTRVNCI